MRNLIIITIVTFIMLPIVVQAEEVDQKFSKLESGSIVIENPFLSQLPEIEEPEEPVKPIEDLDKTIEKDLQQGTPVELGEEEEKPLPSITITGIIWKSDRPQAIINNKVIDIGDNVSGIQITGIRKEGIDGLFDGKKVTLKAKGAFYD